MAAIINQTILEFKTQAFVNGEFKEISSDDVKGKWAVLFFYPYDFTLDFPTELEDATGEWIREKGHEYGVTTGRSRRCGWLQG